MLWKCPYFPYKNVFYYIAVNNNETAYNDLRRSYFWYKPSILQFSLFFYWCKLIFDLQKKELLVGLFKYLRQLVFLKQKCLICIFNYCCFEVNTAVNPGTLQHLRWSSFRQYLTFGHLSFVAKWSVLNLAGFLYLPLIRCVFKLCSITK